MRITATIALLCAFFTTSAEARHRAPAISPECNVTMPCDLSYSAPRAQKRVRVARYSAPRAQKHVARPARIAVEKPVTVQGVVKAASGVVAYVAGQATEAFQCLVNKLELQGYPIREMGGFARSGHIPHSFHYRGLALDVNQIARNVTRPRMPSNEIEIAHSCGLVSGAQWANGDSGHFQLGGYEGHRRYAHHKPRQRLRLTLNKNKILY